MATSTAAPPAPAEHASDETTLYRCCVCGEQETAARMSKGRDRLGRVKVYGRCLRCDNARKRRLEQLIVRDEHGHASEEVLVPDPWPARLLLELMAEDLRAGWTFDDAWPDNLRFVVRQIAGPAQRASWRAALTGTRAAWEDAWNDEPGPARQLSPTLLAVA